MCALTVVRRWFRRVVSCNHVRGSAALASAPKTRKSFRLLASPDRVILTPLGLLPRHAGGGHGHTPEGTVLKLIFFFVGRLLDSPNDSWDDDYYVDDPLAS